MLHEVMGWPGPMTARQFATWQSWLSMEMNQPSRADYYLMQIAFYVARSSAKNPNSILFDRMKLKFRSEEDISNIPPEEMNARIIANSLARLGNVKIRDEHGNPITKKEIIQQTLARGKKKQEPQEEDVNSNIILE